MIYYSGPLGAGNAALILVRPPADAAAFRLLRKVGAIASATDPDAYLVDSGSCQGQMSFVDIAGLVNGVVYRYQVFYSEDSVAWTASDYAEVTPQADYEGDSQSVQDIVLDRLDAGLKVEVARGTLRPPKDLAAIEVLRSPPVFEDNRLPVVTVEFVSGRPEVRAIGEQVETVQDFGSSGFTDGSVGWLERVELVISAWTLNPDERISFRTAVKRILMANWDVFWAAGITQIDLSQQDNDDYVTYAAPIYASMTTFSCLAKTRVTSMDSKIADIQITRACEA